MTRHIDTSMRENRMFLNIEVARKSNGVILRGKDLMNDGKTILLSDELNLSEADLRALFSFIHSPSLFHPLKELPE